MKALLLSVLLPFSAQAAEFTCVDGDSSFEINAAAENIFFGKLVLKSARNFICRKNGEDNWSCAELNSTSGAYRIEVADGKVKVTQPMVEPQPPKLRATLTCADKYPAP